MEETARPEKADREMGTGKRRRIAYVPAAWGAAAPPRRVCLPRVMPRPPRPARRPSAPAWGWSASLLLHLAAGSFAMLFAGALPPPRRVATAESAAVMLTPDRPPPLLEDLPDLPPIERLHAPDLPPLRVPPPPADVIDAVSFAFARPPPPDAAAHAEIALFDEEPPATGRSEPAIPDLTAYWRGVRSAILQKLRFPPIRGYVPLETSVTVRLVVDHRGELAELAAPAQDPRSVFVVAVLRAVRAAAPFDAPPGDEPRMADLPVRFVRPDRDEF